MWQGEQNLACPGCGQPRDEVWVFDPDEQAAKQDAVKAGRRRCVACAASEWDQHQFHEARRDHPTSSVFMGMHHTVERTDDG